MDDSAHTARFFSFQLSSLISITTRRGRNRDYRHRKSHPWHLRLMQRERGRGVNATNWRCHRTVARGVEYGFEMAAKFPSIALVKYRDEGRARRREWGREMSRVQGRGGILSRMQGKDASQLRKLRLCSRPLRAHRPRKSVMTAGAA